VRRSSRGCTARVTPSTQTCSSPPSTRTTAEVSPLGSGFDSTSALMGFWTLQSKGRLEKILGCCKALCLLPLQLDTNAPLSGTEPMATHHICEVRLLSN
jgi:hypothetical protein